MIVGPSTRTLRSSRSSLFALAVIAVALALRIGWAAWVAHAHPEAVTSPDSPDYLGSARALFDTGSFSLSPQDDTPMFLRVPGYPVFVGAILWITNSQWSISPIQAGLSVFTVVIVVLVGRRMINPTAGLVAGVIVALDPLQFASSGTILAESLATLLLVAVVAAAVLVFARAPERVELRYPFAMGVLIATATLVRPTTYYFPIVVVMLLMIRFRHLPWRSTLAVVSAFVLPSVVLVGGWMVRNHDAVDSWQLSGSQAITLYCWHAAEVEARANGVTIRDAREDLECEPGGGEITTVCPSWWACDERQPLAHGPSWDEMNRRGIEILMRHPLESTEVFVRGLVREIAAPGTDTVGRYLHADSSPALAAVLFLWNIVLWALAIVGAAIGLRSSRRWFWVFVISIIVYVMVVSAGANAGARFRTPIGPLLALLAALGAYRILQCLRDMRSPTRRSPLPGDVDAHDDDTVGARLDVPE